MCVQAKGLGNSLTDANGFLAWCAILQGVWKKKGKGGGDPNGGGGILQTSPKKGPLPRVQMRQENTKCSVPKAMARYTLRREETIK